MNPTVGDLAGNIALARRAWEEGKAAGADMVALPEMFVTGYQTQDLVMKPAFTRDAMAHVEASAWSECADGPAHWDRGHRCCKETSSTTPITYPERRPSWCGRCLKRELPNETVFDEVRLLRTRGHLAGPYDLGDRAGRLLRYVRTPGMRKWRRRWRNQGLRSFWCRTARLTIANKFDDRSEQHGRAGGRDRIAPSVSQHDRRAGRSGVRRRHVRSEPGW